jgi:uncharacterized protein YeaO (DUF488 family)
MTRTQQHIQVKRVYEEASSRDGCRVLVDALWPRGIKKEDLKMNSWCKELAPSAELRKQFHKQPDSWSDFRQHYLKELKYHSADVEKLFELAKGRTLTLLYGSRDTEHNNAVVLRDFLLSQKN